MNISATIIIPTFDHSSTLKYSILTALGQTVKDLEVFVIGDGAPTSAKRIVEGFAAKDSRVKWFEFPKDKRHGEIYRHQVLQEAEGEIVCYLSDDDLWLPNHVQALMQILRSNDFACTLPIRIVPGDKVEAWPLDLAQPFFVKMLMRGENRIPLSFMAHRLDFYKRLSYGWRTSPRKVPSDLYMWQQFLRAPKARYASSSTATALHFASSSRQNMSPQQRLNELARWSKRTQARNFPADLNTQLLNYFLGELARSEATFTVALHDNQVQLATQSTELERLSQVTLELDKVTAELEIRKTELGLIHKSRIWRLRNAVRTIFPEHG